MERDAGGVRGELRRRWGSGRGGSSMGRVPCGGEGSRGAGEVPGDLGVPRDVVSVRELGVL